jgi:hypothetical protein
VRSSSSRGLVPVTVVLSVIAILVEECTAGVPSARRTRPSRKVYKASKNALVILEMNAGAIAFCFVGFEVEVLEDDRSTPPAILKAAVVMCR